jgi:adenylate kinase
MKIVLMGAPGAGKGTQATGICERFNLPHISTGDILRKNIREKTELGMIVKEIIDNGQLVTDDIIVKMMKSRLQEPDCKNGWLLDGFPRTIAQAVALDGIEAPDVALNIDVPFEKLFARISGRRMCACGETYHVSSLNGKTDCAKCGKELYQRDDDKEETVKVRLNAYEQQTAPLIDYYAQQGKLVSVNGDDTVDNVSNNVSQALLKL